MSSHTNYKLQNKTICRYLMIMAVEKYNIELTEKNEKLANSSTAGLI